MSALITVTTQESPVTTITQFEGGQNVGWAYFDTLGALKEVYAHIAQLPGSGNPERHTLRVYDAALRYFINWLGPRLDMDEVRRGYPTAAGLLADYPRHILPTRAEVRNFIAHLKTARGLTAKSINTKYLSPVRLYLRALEGQDIAVVGDDRDAVGDVRFQLRKAAEVKGPRNETKTALSPLYAQGVRLSVDDVNRVLLDVGGGAGLDDMRDYALLLVGFTTGLRVAELARVTLSSIQAEGGNMLIRVRRKRGNMTPVVLQDNAYEAIKRWVEAYNGGLGVDDPRRIGPDVPLWQALHRGGAYVAIGRRGFDPERGLSHEALRQIVNRRTGLVLAPVWVKRRGKAVRVVSPEWTFSPHDMRRTLAAIANEHKMPLDTIRGLLGHANLATTARYIGDKPDFDAQKIGNYVKIG